VTVIIRYASLACVTAGLISGALALVIARDVRVAMRVALDLWLAAGLLRLALPSSAAQLLGVATIILVRQLVGTALRQPAARESGAAPPAGPLSPSGR
jgi:hypothetical protein